MKDLRIVLVAGAVLGLVLMATVSAQASGRANHPQVVPAALWGGNHNHANANAVQTGQIKGKSLRNPQGDKLGTIDNFVVDPSSGHVLYVIVAEGGVVGVGAKYVAVPWQAVSYDASKNTFALNMSKDRFHAAPTYTSGNQPDFSNTSWQESNDRYFGVTEPAEQPAGRMGAGGSVAPDNQGAQPKESAQPGSSQD